MGKNIDFEELFDIVNQQAESFVPETAKSEQELRIKILEQAVDTANKVNEMNREHENEKSIWRRIFIIFLCILLLGSLIFIGILLVQDKLSDFQLSVLIGYIVVNIFSILFFMIKYVHNDLYLETFKTVTQNLLEYLIQDKTKKDDRESIEKNKND